MNSSKRTESPDLFGIPSLNQESAWQSLGSPSNSDFSLSLHCCHVLLYFLHRCFWNFRVCRPPCSFATSLKEDFSSTRQDPFPAFFSGAAGPVGHLALPFALLPLGLKLYSGDCLVNILMEWKNCKRGQGRNEMLFWGGCDNWLDRRGNLACECYWAASETETKRLRCWRADKSGPVTGS